MATMKTDTISNMRGSNDDWRVIETHFDGRLFRKFPSESCYTLLLTLVQQFAIRTRKNELYNRKIVTFERFLALQKALVKFKHRKLVFLKIKSSVYKNVH